MRDSLDISQDPQDPQDPQDLENFLIRRRRRHFGQPSAGDGEQSSAGEQTIGW